MRKIESMSAATLIRHTRSIFSDFGVPSCIVSDNGTQFLSQNGVKFLNSPPFHPSSNGIAERPVQSFKDKMKKTTQGDWETGLARVLFAMRNSVCTATNRTPAEIFFSNLKVKTPLDVIRPQSEKQARDDVETGIRRFQLNQEVLFRDYRKNNAQWSRGTVVKTLGSRLYEVADELGQLHRRSVDQIISRLEDMSDADVQVMSPPFFRGEIT